MAFRHRRESYDAGIFGKHAKGSSGGGLRSSLALVKATVTRLPPGALGPSTQRLADRVLSRMEQQKMYGCFCRYASAGASRLRELQNTTALAVRHGCGGHRTRYGICV